MKMHSYLARGLVLLLIGVGSKAHAADLATAKANYEKRAEEIRKADAKERLPLSVKYLGALDKIGAASQAKGVLDDVLEVDKERTRYGKAEGVSLADIHQGFPALANLQRFMHAELKKLDAKTAAAIAELNAKYLRFLRAQVIELVREDKIEEAKALRVEIQRVQGGGSEVKPTAVAEDPAAGKIAKHPKFPEERFPTDGSPHLLTGSAPGQGGDFSGKFLYAVDFAGEGGNVGDANFLPVSKSDGLIVSKVKNASSGAEIAFKSGSTADQLLGDMIYSHSYIKEEPLYFSLGVKKGSRYRLQLMWVESQAKLSSPGKRVFNVSVAGRRIISGLDLAKTGEIKRSNAARTKAVISTLDVVAKSELLLIKLDPQVENAQIGALTLEVMGRKGMDVEKRPAGSRYGSMK